MMLPMAVSVAGLFAARLGADEKAKDGLGLALLLGVAYAASIGGVGTLIGTAPNAFMAGFLRENYGMRVGFAEWMLVGVPFVIAGIAVAHGVLARM
jgi:sodium-dependent dicarboxylate transporter 2/3/5